MRTFVLALLFLIACSPDVEQQAHPAPEPAPSADLASQDRDFLERAAEGGKAEIAIGTLALVDGHTRRAEVAAFGRLMAADHSVINKQLTGIAASKRISLPTSLGEHQQNFDRLLDLRHDEFDREFVRVMIEDHQDAVQLYREEAGGGVDPELKAFAAATLVKIEAHLAHAERLPRG